VVRVVMFSAKPYDRRSFAARNASFGHSLHYREPRLSEETATLAAGFPAVCLFVNDVCDAAVLEMLAAGGTRLIALRCAGFNNVNLAAADALGLPVVRVPAYSPHAVAEFTIGMILTLNRQLHRAYKDPRQQFRARRPFYVRPVREDRGRDRYRKDWADCRANFSWLRM